MPLYICRALYKGLFMIPPGSNTSWSLYISRAITSGISSKRPAPILYSIACEYSRPDSLLRRDNEGVNQAACIRRLCQYSGIN
jgi:hypothetical protein